MTDPLAKLLGSAVRVKLLRLFLFNPTTPFSISEAAERVRADEKVMAAEFAFLTSLGLIKRMGRSANPKKIPYLLKEDFPYLLPLQQLLLNAQEQGNEMYNRLRSTGTIKFLVLSGIFVGEWDGRLDLLIVGDKVNERKLEDRIRRTESDIGRELRYALLQSHDFSYRLAMNDHLLRDVLDYPHKVVYDRLNTGLE